MSDIGPQPLEDHSDTGSKLVCVTIGVSIACCKGKTNKTNDRAGLVGEWLYINGTTVPDGNGSNVVDFATYPFTNQIRLA